MASVSRVRSLGQVRNAMMITTSSGAPSSQAINAGMALSSST
jgi:hypothetical protein